MNPNTQRFLDALAGVAGPPVLFEPFVPAWLAEQLIWRRGTHLWDTVPAYLDTLLSLRERTYADVIVADMRIFGDQSAEAMAQLAAAMTATGVCAAGLYHWQTWLPNAGNAYNKEAKRSLPLIAMDGCCASAADSGFAGWFCPENGEDFWHRYGFSGENADTHKPIAILGGLGVDWLASSQPVTIHNRCEEIFRLTKGAGFLVGSGGAVSPEDYLSLISLLGICRRWR